MQATGLVPEKEFVPASEFEVAQVAEIVLFLGLVVESGAAAGFEGQDRTAAEAGAGAGDAAGAGDGGTGVGQQAGCMHETGADHAHAVDYAGFAEGNNIADEAVGKDHIQHIVDSIAGTVADTTAPLFAQKQPEG